MGCGASTASSLNDSEGYVAPEPPEVSGARPQADQAGANPAATHVQPSKEAELEDDQEANEAVKAASSWHDEKKNGRYMQLGCSRSL